MKMLILFPFYQMTEEREKQREEGSKGGSKRQRKEGENSAAIFLKESFCGHKISMSGSDAKSLWSKSVLGAKNVRKKIGKMQRLSQEIPLILFKEQRHFLRPSKHLHELQGERGRACRFLIAERLSSPGQSLSVFADSCQSLFFMLSNRAEIEGWG